jgi:hypothetical protein
MLLNTEERPVAKCIPEATTAFTIKHSRKAFEILSDKLYTDKHGAVVRELAQNAYDSHIDAGRPEVPIEIDLPTRLDPVFRVRDFGTGLEHEQILNLYTTYFESNKSHTNEFVGGLGLGSKSPFSYVDQFTVESYTASGDKNTYCAFISEDGTPTITRLESEPYSDRLPGITIDIAVKQEDFRLFRQAAAKMLKFYKTYPKILGKGDDSSLTPIEYSMKGKFIGIRKDGSRQQYGLPKSYVLMGPVAYEIDHDQLNEGNKSKYGQLFQLPCVFFSKVGKLDIHVSRERLSYDQKTKDELSHIFEKAEDEVQTLTKAYIAAGATKFEKFTRFYEAHSKIGTWARKLKRAPSLSWNSDIASTMVVNCDRWKYKDPLSTSHWSMGFTYFPNRWASETPNLLYVDVKHHVKWIKHNNREFVGENWVLLRGSDEDRIAFEKRFNTVAVRLSTLDEPPPPEKRASVQSGDLYLYSYKPSNSYDVCQSMDISRKIFHSKHLKEEFAAYIPTRGQCPLFNGGKSYNMHRAKVIVETLGRHFTLEDRDVLGIPASYTQVQKDSGLPLFDDVLTYKLQKWGDEQDIKAFSTMYLFKESHAERKAFIRDIFDQVWITKYIQAHPTSALTQLYHYSCYELYAKHYQFNQLSEMLSKDFVEKITGEKAKRAYAKKMDKINRLLDTIYKKHPYLVTMHEGGQRICNQSNLRYWDTMKHYFELAERKR